MKHITSNNFKKFSIILISSILLFNFNVFSQNKDLQNLKKIYESQQYDKCIEKSKQISQKQPQSPIPYYYASFSFFGKFLISQQNQKRILLQSTLTNLKMAYSKDKDSLWTKEYKNQFFEIHDTTLNYANSMYSQDKNIAGIFYKFLAEIFKDTTQQYIELFEPQRILPPQQLSYAEYSGPINQTDFDGRKQGVWIEKYQSGLVKSEIFYKDGKPAGIFNKYYENGKPRVKMVFDVSGTRAAAILYNTDGQKVAMGYYYNKQKDSLWQYFVNDTILIAEENYIKGVKNGYERNYSVFAPILLEEKFYKDGKLNGKWTRYNIEGKKVFEANYINGVRTGAYANYDENGKVVVKGQYKNNLPDGTWKYWNDKTKSYLTIEYLNGIPKDIDKLTEEEQKFFQLIDKQVGKFEEPADYIKKTYNYND